jgi:DNA-binding transcriptional ArsR family regulator
MKGMSDAALERVAAIFKMLSEPRRLKLLSALQDGEKNVSELVRLTDTSQANASKHLAVLTQAGIVSREQRGNSVYYRMADPCVYQLCDLVCGQLLRKLLTEQEWQTEFMRLGAAADEKPARRKRA